MAVELMALWWNAKIVIEETVPNLLDKEWMPSVTYSHVNIWRVNVGDLPSLNFKEIIIMLFYWRSKCLKIIFIKMEADFYERLEQYTERQINIRREKY